jgi:hypothetical protein
MLNREQCAQRERERERGREGERGDGAAARGAREHTSRAGCKPLLLLSIRLPTEAGGLEAHPALLRSASVSLLVCRCLHHSAQSMMIGPTSEGGHPPPTTPQRRCGERSAWAPVWFTCLGEAQETKLVGDMQLQQVVEVHQVDRPGAKPVSFKSPR